MKTTFHVCLSQSVGLPTSIICLMQKSLASDAETIPDGGSDAQSFHIQATNVIRAPTRSVINSLNG
jgi:hypothetical protein